MKGLLSILLLTFCTTGHAASTLMQEEIEHVVVVMLENRSFDSVLGWLYGEENPPANFIPEGTDPHFWGLSEEMLAQYTNDLIDSKGNLVYSVAPIKGIPSVAGTGLFNSPAIDPHEIFAYVTQQIYGGKALMTGFLQNYASLWDESQWVSRKLNISACLETYTENELPIFYCLARHYGVSDSWFSSVPTQTNPNRAFTACGTSEGQIVNGPFTKSLFLSDTIWNKLPSSSWMIFWHADMLPGIISGPMTGPNTFQAMKNIPNLESHYQKIDGFHELARTGKLPAFSFIEPQFTSQLDLSPLYLGVEGNDMHPPGDMRTAENLLANIYTSLIANRESWNKTLLVVMFDEHGGLFDHMLPPQSTPPDSSNQFGFSFDRFGVRVPVLFISPKVEKSVVLRPTHADVPFDHTSLLATLLNWQNIDQKNWNMGARVNVAPTFDSCITRDEPRLDAIIMPANVVMPVGSQVQMGDTVYLSNKDGKYITRGSIIHSSAKIGSAEDKIALTFAGGVGGLTHGSFVLIQTQNDGKLLSSSLADTYCFYEAPSHTSEQWWTIKSVDYPYLGAPINYGDRIYLENHIYLDMSQVMPARLSGGAGFLGDLLSTTEISSPAVDELYWEIAAVSDMANS